MVFSAGDCVSGELIFLLFFMFQSSRFDYLNFVKFLTSWIFRPVPEFQLCRPPTVRFGSVWTVRRLSSEIR